MKRIEKIRIIGYGAFELWDGWPEDGGRLMERREFENLVTAYGDQMYAERGAGIGDHLAPTGMQLGTGTSAVNKDGVGSSIISYISGSSMSFTATWPQSSIVSGSRQIQYKAAWGPGVAQEEDITEAAIINQTISTDAAAGISETVSRALISSIDKSDPDAILVGIWNHLFLGA